MHESLNTDDRARNAVSSWRSSRPGGTPSMNGARGGDISWLGSLCVGEIMTQPAICVDPQTRLPEARGLMKGNGIRRLPVIDDGRLVGIITLGDVRGAWPSEVTSLNRSELDYLMQQVTVERVMTRAVLTVGPETSLVDAARLMTAQKISGLPVVSSEGRVVGVVTESDIFRTLVALIEMDHRSPLPTREEQP